MDKYTEADSSQISLVQVNIEQIKYIILNNYPRSVKIQDEEMSTFPYIYKYTPLVAKAYQRDKTNKG